MKNASLVALHEYTENARTKGFWIGILIFPAILCLAIKVAIYLATDGKPKRHYVIADFSGGWGEELSSALDDSHQEAVSKAMNAGMGMQEAIEGLSVDAEMKALEGVRDHIARISTERQLDREIEGDDSMKKRLRSIRDDVRMESARRELVEIKRQLQGRELADTAASAGESVVEALAEARVSQEVEHVATGR